MHQETSFRLLLMVWLLKRLALKRGMGKNGRRCFCGTSQKASPNAP